MAGTRRNYHRNEGAFCKGCCSAIAPGELGLEFSLHVPLAGWVHLTAHDDPLCLAEAAGAMRGAGLPEVPACHGCGLEFGPGEAWLSYHNGRRRVWVHDEPECLKQALGVRFYEG
ncbi:hypothetical protein EDC14_1001163 [Hydrogenispora ethanolica]|jgi:hypothetical protein|uniref:Uncharacterized protein n=1 Tax=Hydrogenispora ethanolica TaxID=1082276 RepID=A0A4R1SBK9_HYDET|nr:hypothetical protein [Hydrogenispora ethanolica]TCL76878.1 hypothetical protein EDC14_1001163 [Hydrogenispora ethanolica]